VTDAVGPYKACDTRRGPQPAHAVVGRPTGRTADVARSVVDTIDSTYDTLGRLDQLKRSGTVLSDFAYNGDGTISSRIDGDAGAIGTSTYTYDWADRLQTADLPNTRPASLDANLTFEDQSTFVSLADVRAYIVSGQLRSMQTRWLG